MNNGPVAINSNIVEDDGTAELSPADIVVPEAVALPVRIRPATGSRAGMAGPATRTASLSHATPSGRSYVTDWSGAVVA